MGKDYYMSDGNRVHVDDHGIVSSVNGVIGIVDQFGDFHTSNGSKHYKMNNYGQITGTDGSSGQIYHGNQIVMDKKTEKNKQ